MIYYIMMEIDYLLNLPPFFTLNFNTPYLSYSTIIYHYYLPLLSSFVIVSFFIFYYYLVMIHSLRLNFEDNFYHRHYSKANQYRNLLFVTITTLAASTRPTTQPFNFGHFIIQISLKFQIISRR